MRRFGVALVGLAAACGVWFVVATGCGGSKKATVSIIGSTSVQPFAEMLAEEFNKKSADIYVEVQGGGSTAGIQAISSGIAQICSCSRELSPEETGFTTTVIARDGVALVVHPSNPVNDLTLEQVRNLFCGRVSNWADVRGKDGAVRLITREEGSGTREAFTHLVMAKSRIAATALTQESNGAVRELVKHDPNAIGFMSLGLVGAELKALKVGGVTASSEDVLNGTYPLVRPFLFVTRGPAAPAALRFIDYVLSAEAQQMLEKEGLVRAKK